MHPGYIRRHLTKDLFQPFLQLVATFLRQFQQLWQQTLLRRRGRRGHLRRPARQPWGKGPRPWEHRRCPQQQTKAHDPCERSTRMCHGHGWKSKFFDIAKIGWSKTWVLTFGRGEADSKSHRLWSDQCFTHLHFDTLFHSVQQGSTVRYFKSARLKDVLKTCWILALLVLNWNHLTRSLGAKIIHGGNCSWGTSWLWGPMLPCWCCVV